jgi:hypothetical protein
MGLFASSPSIRNLIDEAFCLDAGAGGIIRPYPVGVDLTGFIDANNYATQYELFG